MFYLFKMVNRKRVKIKRDKKVESRFNPVNVLTWLVLAMFVLQGVSVFLMMGEINDVREELSNNLNSAKIQLNQKVDLVDSDLQSRINSVSASLLNVENDLSKEISSIKAKTSSDFSGIIEGVVSDVTITRIVNEEPGGISINSVIGGSVI